MLSGPYANTGIGASFKAAQQGAEKGQAYLTDFAPYGPSYNAPASFISSPIYDGNEMIAVLIFQMPVDRINDVVNYKQSWEKNGLGQTGQTYLIGADKQLRSNVRQMYQDKQAYLTQLSELGVDRSTLQNIDVRNTTIGQKSISSAAVDASLNGQSGSIIEDNYLGTKVVASYQPISVLGIRWGLISEISEAEALAPIEALASKIQRNIWIAAITALIVGALLGYLFAVYMTRPIKHMIHMVNDLSNGEGDLTQRLPEKGNDELAQLSHGINHFIAQIDSTLSEALKSVVRLIPISEDTAGVINQLNDANETQRQQAEHMRGLLTLTNEASEAVSLELAEVDQSTQTGVSTVMSSREQIRSVADTISIMSKDITAAISALDTLKDDTQKITGIIDVINGIDEQTNLLALNAAIEAARAGEAGRGFAVVADEVRTLASRTSESTSEVAAMVSAIQNSTSSVSQLMESSGHSAERSVTQVESSVNTLDSADEAMGQIAARVQGIGQSIESQQSTFVQVTESYSKMNASFEEVREHSYASAKVGNDVMKLGRKITGQIERFKVSADDISMARRDTLRED
ncbi:Methyl-accepting chemotaxis protein PctB [Marinomonas aquimarina]|uniref:Methyl-accepting chemotaxis protein PctB n=1 Tax=Marinomonas aquimarina TaxID=295068 RepID=A0A1A8TKP9_9GAMM|nr:methyl-accepting chemotaxis protein [Marinomonas aquimarina]SBS34132.1 Methyl-accepting chemotaxis protein PctB [Marinomonas aquimarina]